MSDKPCLEVEEIDKFSSELYQELHVKMCSKCIGTILTLALGNLLINAPDIETFEKYKSTVIECLQKLEYE